ncbi:transcriptional regulator with XRE-family HTH domain [Brevundimonas alba]|uniref:Transcriptional regulator with XRE-family HTH domain n=1 Tax=Brevundimonas alba TaxID=74314 RepID=A0A7X5YK45_9CAUL|nr:helix-turn-helix transcriptional regulator [Brevundimonas alba]NJC40711.1 transcriptional regulator with XRE-family HTH domain [Brevundimonas alba]
MPRFESDSDARRLGEALAGLRREAGLSQAEAGERVGMTSQGWGLYESGKRPGLFRPDVQRRLTTAIGSSAEELALQLSVPPAASETSASGMENTGRAYPGPPTGGTRRLQLSNDDLSPWAASGVVLEYEPGRWPRRDQGCVIEMADGEVRVRLYDSADAEALTVRGVRGGEERIARADTRQVSAVVARMDV